MIWGRRGKGDLAGETIPLRFGLPLQHVLGRDVDGFMEKALPSAAGAIDFDFEVEKGVFEAGNYCVRVLKLTGFYQMGFTS